MLVIGVVVDVAKLETLALQQSSLTYTYILHRYICTPEEPSAVLQ